MKKKYLFAFVLSFLLLGLGIQFGSLSVNTVHAAQDVPIVGMQFGDLAGGGCDNTTGQPIWTPAGGGQSEMRGDSNDYEPNCARIQISPNTPGPYNYDFQIGIRLMSSAGGDDGDGSKCNSDPNQPAGPWVVTPFVYSGQGGSPGGQWTWTPWESDGRPPNGYDIDCGQIEVIKGNALPPGVLISNPFIEAQTGEGTSGGLDNCQQPPNQQEGVAVAPVGTWSSWSFDPDNIDCMRVSASGISLGAQYVTDNFHTITFNPSQRITTGSDGQPVSITVQNTGGEAWIADQKHATGQGTGTCLVDTDGDGILDAPKAIYADKGDSCTVPYLFTSSQYRLVHTGGMFGVGSSPATFSIQQNVKRTDNCFSNGGDGGALRGDVSKQLAFAGSVLALGDGGGGNGGGGGYTCEIDASPYSANIEPGDTAQFLLTSLTAPSGNGTYNETWQMEQNSTLFGQSMTIPLTVGAQGGITVGSHNIVTNGPVTASWEFTSYPSEDPCSVGPCYEIPTGTYSGLPGGPYTMNPDPAPHGYSFRSIQEIPIAQTPKTKLDSLFALGQDLLFPIAHAVQEDPNYPWSQPLSPGGSDTMIILWDPQAALSVNPGSLSINQSNPSATLSLSNSGSPGSTSTWAATSDSNWLTVSPSAGTDLQTGNPVTLTVTATTTGLSAGTHIAHISFSGTSYPSGQNLSLIPGALPSPVTVTFTVNEVCGDGIIQPPEQCDNGPQNGICPATCSQTCQNQTCSPVPTCPIFNPVPPSIVIPDSSNLDYRCINVSACSLSGGQFNGLPLPLTGTSTIAGTQVATPATTTVYTITCQGIPPPPPGDPNYTIHATVNVSVQGANRCETINGVTSCSN